MVELVASEGYEALTVRSLAKRARISSGAFYDHYRSADDCFLSTFDRICRCVTERLLEAARDQPNPQRRLERAFDRLFRDMVASPQTAQFMLRAAPAAGPAFTSRLRSSAMRVGIALEYCLGAGDGPRLPPALVEGVVAGLARVGRVSVPQASQGDAGGLATEAAEWVLGLCVPEIQDAECLTFELPPALENGVSASAQAQTLSNGTPGDERAMILAAAFRIARSGYQQLSAPRICREAGVSRRTFNRHFQNVDECFFSAVEERVSKAVAASARGRLASASWSAAVNEVLGTLCEAIDADVDSARVLFVELFAAGTQAIDSRDRLISLVARALRASAPEGDKPSVIAAEASTAAVWAVLRRRIAGQRAAAPVAGLPSVAYLMLAPAIGQTAALHTIEARLEASPIDKKRLAQVLDFP